MRRWIALGVAALLASAPTVGRNPLSRLARRRACALRHDTRQVVVKLSMRWFGH